MSEYRVIWTTCSYSGLAHAFASGLPCCRSVCNHVWLTANMPHKESTNRRCSQCTGRLAGAETFDFSLAQPMGYDYMGRVGWSGEHDAERTNEVRS